MCGRPFHVRARPPHLGGGPSTPVPFAVATTARNPGPRSLGVVRAGWTTGRAARSTVRLGGVVTITVPFSRGGRLDMPAAGRNLLADAVAPAPSRCRPGAAF